MIEPVNMPKLQSPFVRDYTEIKGSKHYVVTPERNIDYLWVFEDPDVYAMEKLDGTNVSVVIENGNLKEVWNRKNLVSKVIRNDDTNTIWEHTEGFNHVIEAIQNSMDIIPFEDGQHFGECIGLGIQKNPLDLPDKKWIPFDTFGKENLVYNDWQNLPKDFESISNYMKNLKSKYYGIIHPDKKPEYAEGIILYRSSTGERAKLRRDMFDWWIVDNPGRINKHVNTYSKPKKKMPEGMNKEFAELSVKKKQGLITLEEFNKQRDIILEKYGIKK